MDAKSIAYVLSAVFMIGDGFGFKLEKESNHRWKRSVLLPFNDPGYLKQFYLNDRFGVTMNIRKAWLKGYTGKNVTVCINDPAGVEYKHDDFLPRFNLAGSYNFDENKTDPSPTNTPGFLGVGHGTAMAGLAVGQANNGKCGVGVAFDAYITAIRTTTRAQYKTQSYAASLVYGNQINDIYSCSWGPIGILADVVGYMPPAVKVSVKNGAEKGRGGKGSIYVFANGNGDRDANGTCGYDEYISSIYTISISVVTGKNEMAIQNVPCTGVSAVTYARDGGVGVSYPRDLMPTCWIGNSCKRTADATSAATAVASGIFALVLQANPNLGWRDVQHLVARSSSSAFPSVVWKTNTAGIRVSDGFGFGLLDADALIENAKNWTNVGRQYECILDYRLNERIDGVNTTVKSINLTSWPANCGGESQHINFLEHVLLVVSFNYTQRYSVEIEVEAPTGTKSLILRSGALQMLTFRAESHALCLPFALNVLPPCWMEDFKMQGRTLDYGSEVKDLSILSLHHWGENPKGIWTMKLRNVEPNPADSGNLYRYGFQFYGTKDDPLTSNTIKPSQIRQSSINATSRAPVTPKNSASQSASGTSPTVSGIWTNAISGTTGATRKVPTTIKNGSGPVLKSCKSTYFAAATLVLSLFWKMNS